MLKRVTIIITLLIASLHVAYASDAVINGVVTGKNIYSSVSLNTLTNNFITTAVVSPDGKFTLTVNVEKTDCYVLAFVGDRGLRRQVFTVLSPNDKINLELASDYADLGIAKVTGSAELAFIKACQDKNSAIAVQMKHFEDEYAKAETADRRLYRTAIMQYISSILSKWSSFTCKIRHCSPPCLWHTWILTMITTLTSKCLRLCMRA